MSRVLKVSQNDYRLQVRSGGNIILDTGSAVGLVTITGNLDVKGTTTTVESTDTTIKDNIIYINYGEQSDGINSVLDYRAGLQIDRGTRVDAQFVFDEHAYHYDPILDETIEGTFVLKTVDNQLSGLQLNTIASKDTGSNIYFDLQNSDSNVLSLVNVDATVYSELIFGVDSYPTSLPPTTVEDNYLVNKRYVQSYIASGAYTPGMADVDKIHKSILGVEKSRVQAYTSTIDCYINGSTLVARMSTGGVDINNINILNNTVKNSSVATQLILTAVSNLVEVDSVLSLTDQGSAPITSAGKTKIYAKSTVGPGKSGLFFANLNHQDELVAKNRALLFSMLF